MSTRVFRPAVTGILIAVNTRPIRFYRERGVWTPAMDQTQQKLLAINP